MAGDKYFFDFADGTFFRRKGGNKIEPVFYFRVMRKVPGVRIPEMTNVLMPGITVDQSHVLFFYWGSGSQQPCTATRLRKSGEFLLPKLEKGHFLEGSTDPLPRKKNPEAQKSQKNRTKKKGPRR